VLRLYLELGDLSSALRLYRKMRAMSTVHLDAEAYIHVIAGIAESGRFARNAKPIEGARELGYANSSGPGLFDELCTEMAAEIIEVPEGSGKRLYNALARGFPDSCLTGTESLAPLKVSDTRADTRELLVNRVRVDAATGVCPRSGVKLRLIELEGHQKEKLIRGLISLAKTQQVNSKHAQKQTPAADLLMNFYQWLDQREGEPYTSLVDGANVGYYQQNFDGGKFSYHQIQFVVDSLERMGEKVLVVLPSKYTLDWFRVSTAAPGSQERSKQRLTPEEKRIRNELLRQEKLVRIPPGYLGESHSPASTLLYPSRISLISLFLESR